MANRPSVIAQELVQVIKSNVSVDWMHRTSARANIRRHMKRLLRKYGCPPDLQDAAVQNVLQQAKALSEEWAGAQRSVTFAKGKMQTSPNLTHGLSDVCRAKRIQVNNSVERSYNGAC